VGSKARLPGRVFYMPGSGSRGNSGKYIYFFFHNLNGGIVPANSADDSIDDLVHLMIMVAYAGNTNSRHLPEVVIVNLSDGNIELLSESGDERFDDMPFILEALTLRNVYLKPANACIHRK